MTLFARTSKLWLKICKNQENIEKRTFYFLGTSFEKDVKDGFFLRMKKSFLSLKKTSQNSLRDLRISLFQKTELLVSFAKP